ncbi:hypothetical protein U9M48_014125 [Paspalum notatum var. saurae]|uniref:Protein kinase domain-containing protein n=1 Tax=Paspalum notatum var. saurae TaxID=547442 RepID=A0AAQ3WKE4_PASNO
MSHQIVGAPPHRMMITMKAPSTAVAAPAPEEHNSPPLRLSDLEWLGELGKGGFARVIKVRHRGTGAVHALKMTVNPEPVAEEEAKVLRRAAGAPNVVGCYGFLRGPFDEPSYLLDFMDAGSLGRILWSRRGRGIPEPALAEVAAQCVMGLAQLHSRGVAHLDVKPDNFLANVRGEIKIADFNTSRILYGAAGERLQVSITAGTTCYFSPERFAPEATYAEPHGAMAADVWSLGMTVLELFLGRFPILPGSGMAYFYEDLKEVICREEPPSVPEHAEASPELRGFVAACLRKEPGRRARVSQLLSHRFLARRDVVASRRALQEIIVESLF